MPLVSGYRSIRRVARVWDFVFWATIIVASVIALKRRRYLPIAGLLWFAVAILPVSTLSNHAWAAYYLDFTLVGLTFTLVSLPRLFIRSNLAMADGFTLCFVAVQFAAVQRIDDKSSINVAIRRSEAIRARAPSLATHDHTLIFHTHCPQTELSKHGELFRVVRSEPDLDVTSTYANRTAAERSVHRQMFAYRSA